MSRQPILFGVEDGRGVRSGVLETSSLFSDDGLADGSGSADADRTALEEAIEDGFSVRRGPGTEGVGVGSADTFSRGGWDDELSI